ncbi:MAG: DUF928 domain-containing protein [Elainellaceae cyanobacterium]
MNPRFHMIVDVSRWLAIASLITAVSLSPIPSARAEFVDTRPSRPDTDSTVPTTARYVPPERSAPRPGSTAPGTSRGNGCSSASTAGLVPLAPQAHIGLTQTVQPTIAWFNPETEDYTIEFRIAEHLPDGGFNIVYETEFTSAEKTLPSGITVVSLEATDTELAPGKTYRWQAVLVCDPNRPSESLVAESDIQVISASDDLEATLLTLATASQRADFYASQSLWYDAMGEVLMADDDEAQAVQLDFLNDLALLEAAATSASEQNTNLSYDERLRMVIAQIQ